MNSVTKSKLPGIGYVEWEDQDSTFDYENEVSEEFDKLLADTNEGSSIKEGTIVEGIVVGITSDAIRVDIGHKTEGEVPASEFKTPEGTLKVKVGDKIEVYLDSFEDGDGEMILSRERAEMLRAWDRIAEAYEKGEIVEGLVMARVKGGLSVDIGVKAFLPGSQVDLRPVRNLDKLINNKFNFKIIKFNKKRGNIVLSRRALLEQDREKLRAETLGNLKEAAVLKGIVKNITDYGAFIDLGGIDGLLHITDMSWGRINHPSQLFEVGQEIEVKVLNYDEGRQRVSLGYKQLLEDPWEKASAKYQVNTKTKGAVVSLTDYGAFVELEDGIEGLIHISEMSWSKRIRHPSKVVAIGDEVDVVVLALDQESRRISLGMKQMEPNPWEIVKEKYRVGDIIRGRIRNITDFGIFVGIEEGIDGLIHISDISWYDRIKHPGDLFKKGDELEAKILQIDTEGEKFSLGIKQLSEDPWMSAAKTLTPGTKGRGQVTKLTDYGVFVQLAKGVEGMIHISELDVKELGNPSEVVKEGDEIEFVVLSSDADDRRFSLSRKAHMKGLEGDDLKKYMNTVGEPQTVFANAFTQAKEDLEKKIKTVNS
ncbi:MAG: 30S ribosomal protein S1 [Deltaproteobacteria bacterium]|nr:30S ribosomal protein S1 [Deltaproteobacteria bacterium]